jgi:hypothetical protein
MTDNPVSGRLFMSRPALSKALAGAGLAAALVLVPVTSAGAGALPESAAAEGAPAAAPAPAPVDKEKLAAGYQKVGKASGAMGPSADLAGAVVGGETDASKLKAKQKKADEGLDDLMAIVPSKKTRVTPPVAIDLKASIELVRTDLHAMVDAAIANKPEQAAATGQKCLVHLVALGVNVFASFGLDVAGGLPGGLPAGIPKDVPKDIPKGVPGAGGTPELPVPGAAKAPAGVPLPGLSAVTDAGR